MDKLKKNYHKNVLMKYYLKKVGLLNNIIYSPDYNTKGIVGVAIKNGELNNRYISEYQFSPDQRNFWWLSYLKNNIDKLPFKLYTAKPNGKIIYIVKKDKIKLFKKTYPKQQKINILKGLFNN